MPRTSQYNITAGTTNTLGVQGAGIAASAETTWTAGANAYTMGAGTALTAPRTIAALRNSSGNNDTLALGAFNLETFGLLKGGGNTLTVSSTSGVLRQPGTAPASLYLTIGSVSGGIAIDAPIQDNTGALTLVKSGNGLLTLSGANSFSGGVLLNAGMLTLRSANALGTGAMAMAANTTLTYAADADAQLLIGGTFSITGGTGTVVGAAVGSTTTSATINVAGNATVNAGPVKVNVYGVNRAAAAAGINSYTLIHGDTGSTLNAATYSLGMVYNNTDFTLGTLSATATDLTIPVTSQTPLATAYWKGGLLGATQVWAASNGSTQSNWVATSGGANQALAPGAGTDVIFSNSTVTTSPNLTTLGADMTVRSLTQQSSSRSVALQADGFTLTISPSDPTTGIAIKIGATFVSLGANVILGASQTWSNNGSAVLGVSGSVFNGTNLLTIGGTGDSSISGTIGNGPGGLTKTGRGTLTLSGANTYTGATEINGGTLTLSGAAGALNASMVVTVSNNATLTLSNTSTQGTVNRLRDSMNLTSYGGSVNFNNSSGSGLIHTETTGPVSLTQGQLNVSLSTDMTGGAGNSQTLILGGLTRPGAANTATANFAAPVLNTTTNRIQVTGASQTPAGQTIGPWATVSVGSVVQTDYAVYDPSGYILPARIAPSAEGTWTNPANIYAMAADATLTATRTITALVDASTSGQSWLNLGNFNFESYGILAAC